MIIPVFLSSTGKMSAIIVSMKNYSSKSAELYLSPVKSSAKMCGLDIGDDIPYLTLFMDVGSELKPLICNPDTISSADSRTRSKKGNQITVGIVGVSEVVYPCLDSVEVDLIRHLSVAWQNPLVMFVKQGEHGSQLSNNLVSYLRLRFGCPDIAAYDKSIKSLVKLGNPAKGSASTMSTQQTKSTRGRKKRTAQVSEDGNNVNQKKKKKK